MIGEVTIRTLAGVRLAGLAHRGDYQNLTEAFARLVHMFEDGLLWGHVEGAAAVGYDNPRITPVEKLRSDACFIVSETCPIVPPMKEIRYPEGRYAVLEVVGPYRQLAQAYAKLSDEWYPASGEEHRGLVAYEVYLNNPEEVPERELRTEIRLPLA
ncbi:GyrI-like domain-containing protein [Thioclava sp. GXIMD4216]|uniref:GyrI-like domain-containing protein n=1 Tax=Thioclava litoralis TaxID=3076557 RepID=A0ABZ1E3M8_9RHOB|nr:GyrI-like domain-containing protein [Thioclava sp. FTW29]